MAQYDGSIRINTNISTKMAEKSLGTLSYKIVKTDISAYRGTERAESGNMRRNFRK